MRLTFSKGNVWYVVVRLVMTEEKMGASEQRKLSLFHDHSRLENLEKPLFKPTRSHW